MQLMQMQVAVSQSFPVQFFFRTDGNVLFIPVQGIKTLIDQNDGVSGIFDAEGFTLKEKDVDEGQDYQYNIPYPLNNMPVLKQWLIQQQLILPQ